MKRVRLSVLSASVFIAACGSGGEGFGIEDPAAGTFNITAANGQTAAQVAWASVVTSGELTDLGGDLPIASAPGGFSKASQTQPAGFLIRVIQKVPFGPIVVGCQESGTISISGDASDPVAAGDTFKIVSTMCDDGLGEVVDGVIDFTVRDISGDVATGAYLLSMDAMVTDLQVTTAADTITSNGDVTVSLDTSTPGYVDAGTSGTSMTTDTNTTSETITNFQSNQTLDANQQNLPFTLSASGTLDTTQLDGIISYSTPTEFSGEGFAYPSAGVLLVEGTNSSVSLIAVDDVNVTIEIDINGDGAVDETINTTWAALTT